MSDNDAASEITCPRCGQAMRAGYVPAISPKSPKLNLMYLGVWAEGKPRKGFWLPLKLDPRDCIPITTYRCSACGYLEAYAK